MLDFFAGYSGQELIVLGLGALIAFLSGFNPSFSILNWLKATLNIEDIKMQYVVIAFFMILSAVAMWVTGEWIPASMEWTLKNLIEYFGIFYGISQIAYQMLKARQI